MRCFVRLLGSMLVQCPDQDMDSLVGGMAAIDNEVRCCLVNIQHLVVFMLPCSRRHPQQQGGGRRLGRPRATPGA